MDPLIVQWSGTHVWDVARRQHFAISRAQLLELGVAPDAIRHRLADGRLHRWRWRGVYAVGRPELSRQGEWWAALLACGPEAALSHESAGALWRVIQCRAGVIHVSVPLRRAPRRPGLRVHRRTTALSEHLIERDGLPVTDIVCTFVDLAARVGHRTLEGAVNEADKLDLIDPEALRAALDDFGRQPGARPCGSSSTGGRSGSRTLSSSAASFGSFAALACRCRRRGHP